MLSRSLLVCGLALLSSGCGESFETTTSSTTNTGASGGSGATTSTGHGGSGAATHTGGSTTSTGGTGGTGGAVLPPIEVVQATPTKITPDAVDVPTLTWPTNPTAGNAIIVGITCFSDIDNCTILPGAVTDSSGNSYLLAMEGDSVVSSDTHGSRGYIFIAEDVTVADGLFTISADPNGSVPPNIQQLVWGAIEVSGLAPSSLDQTGLFPNTSGITMTTVSTTDVTDHNSELAVAVHSIRSQDDNVNYMHEAGWTQHHLSNNGSTSYSAHSMVTKITTEASVVSHTWQHDEPTRGAVAIIATFRGY